MKRFLTAAVLGSVVAASVAFASAAMAEPGRGDRAGARAGRMHRLHARLHRRAAMRVLRELNLTDTQKALVKESRAATEGARKALREKFRAIRDEARSAGGTKECRQAGREKAKELIATSLASVQPQAQAIFASLDSDQRAVLLRAAAARGKTADDATILRGISRLLLGGRRHRR